MTGEWQSMWEIALLIVAVSFAVLVVFIVPVLLQLRDAAKELEFTLRRTGEILAKVEIMSNKAEEVIDQGKVVMDGAGRAFVAVDRLLGKQGTRYAVKALTVALEVFPVVMTARKLFTRSERR
jgi:hypothetical protein